MERGLLAVLDLLARLLRLGKDLQVAREEYSQTMTTLVSLAVAVAVDHRAQEQMQPMALLADRSSLLVAPAPPTLTQTRQQYMRLAEMVH